MENLGSLSDFHRLSGDDFLFFDFFLQIVTIICLEKREEFSRSRNDFDFPSRKSVTTRDLRLESRQSRAIYHLVVFTFLLPLPRPVAIVCGVSALAPFLRFAIPSFMEYIGRFPIPNPKWQTCSDLRL